MMPEFCQQPPALTEDQLLDVLEGIQAPATRAHLENCEYCMERLEELRQFDDHLSTTLSRFDCYSSQTLSDYVMERLPKPERATVDAHLQFCLACQAEITTLRQFLDREPAQPIPPMKPVRPAPKQSTWTEYIAQYQPISQGTVLRGRTRGPIVLNVHQDLDVILEHHESAGRVTILGQILTTTLDKWEHALVQFHDDASLLTTSVVDELGSFSAIIHDSPNLTIRILSESGIAITIPHIRFED